MEQIERRSHTLLLKIVFIFILSVIAGGLLAPPIFNGLIWLGRSVSGLAFLRQILFEKVVNRCVMLAVLGGAFWMMKSAGLTSWQKQGFERGINWKKPLGAGFGIGVVSMSLLLLAAWLSGAYIPVAEGLLSLSLWLKLLVNLIGAMLIGYVEEWLFRGVIFGTLRKGMGVFMGALVAGLFYSAVHFARPENPVGVVYAHWDSAFRLMPYMFTWTDFYWPFEGCKFLMLFFMGISLCYIYVAEGNLYVVIGLHAGWVWIMRLGDYVFDDRVEGVWAWLFGPTPGVVKSGLALIMSIMFALAGVVLYYGRNGSARRQNR